MTRSTVIAAIGLMTAIGPGAYAIAQSAGEAQAGAAQSAPGQIAR